MNTELKNKIEEVSEQAGIKAFNNAYDNLETEEVCCLCKEIAVENHRAGAEWGYKEAIEKAKAWLAVKGVFGGKTCGDLKQYITDFENNMNKLWGNRNEN